MTDMTSNQPYLLRAFYDWIVDNQLTPYIVVDATNPHVEVPQEFVKDGQIVLNVSPAACVNFFMDVEGLSFQARFSGQPRRISMPSQAVIAIYARENGAGTVFAADDDMPGSPAEEPVSSAPEAPVPPKKGKPSLKVIK